MANYIELSNATLDIPVLDSTRSFRQSLAEHYIGGKLHSKSNKKYVRALDNVSLSLKQGDRLGLIGHNGAGKSTLLQILAGIYPLTEGKLLKKGKVTPLFSTSTGIDIDDTGLDNIKTLGMFLGMNKHEINSKINDIVEFSELGDFINLPVRRYSNGMRTRLCFSVATAIDPEILLLDEGIGAGDKRFAQKAKKRLTDFYQRAGVMVVASHSNDLIKALCNKAVLMRHGKIEYSGSVEDILKKHHELSKQSA